MIKIKFLIFKRFCSILIVILLILNRFEPNEWLLAFRILGYYAYLGYILLEHQHANPILHCFSRILMESQHKEFVEREEVDHTRGILQYLLIPPMGITV